MINNYDQLQVRVILHEAVLKGKAKSTDKLSSLGMRVILQKNKQIKHAKKQHLSKVIQARKLKIKVSEVFNIKNASLGQLSAVSKLQKKVNEFRKLKDPMVKTAKILDVGRKTLSMNTIFGVKETKRNSVRLFSQKSLHQNNIQEDDGRINLFDNFTEQQLDRIEEDQTYYLIKSDLIAVFRKYIQRKRQNNKDFAYQHFSIKPSGNLYYRFSEDMNFDKKSYIMSTLNIDQKKKGQNYELSILTNPLRFDQTIKKNRSKSLLSLRESKKSVYDLLKEKQFMNKEHLIQEQNKRILNIRIERNYFDGLASEKRAIFKDKMHDLIVKKNKCHDEKSIACRLRVKTLREDLGRSIELAETIRSQYLKRSTANKKKV